MGRRSRKREWPALDSDGDVICPEGGDVSQVVGISPYLRYVREGKRGAAKYEEALTRGIRKARGQRVTPRKKRRNRAPLGLEPTCIEPEGVDPPDAAPCGPSVAPGKAPAASGARAPPGQPIQALVEGPGPPPAPGGAGAQHQPP